MLENSFKKFLPAHWQGVAFDAVFILLNLFLLPLIGRRLQMLFERSFQEDGRAFLIISLIIFVIFFWRFIALYLKRVPVQRRLVDEKGLESLGVLWILNLFAVLLSTAFVIVTVLSLLKELGFVDLSSYDRLIGFVGLIFPLAELFLLYRLTRPLSEDEKKKPTANPVAELFADLGLFAHMFVWQAFYNFYLAMLMPNVFNSVSVFVGIFILSAVVFVMFYLGPRTVFLIEDGGYKTTRVSITLVFLTSFVSHLVWRMIPI